MSELSLFSEQMKQENPKPYLTLKEASEWASKFTGKKVTTSNIGLDI